MRKEIQLNSRDNIDNRLIQLMGETLKYRLSTEFNYRVGHIDGNTEEYTFIDPAGGPFISVGSKIEGHIVKAIYKGGIIEFEP